MKQNSKPAFANIDTKLLVDGLFVPTKGKKKGKEYKDINGKIVRLRESLYTNPVRVNKTIVQYQGVEQLGVDDQSVLLAICAIMGVEGVIIKPDGPAGPNSKQLILNLGKNNIPKEKRICSKKVTYRGLLNNAGYKITKSGPTEDMKPILNRLANVQVRYKDEKYGWDFRQQLLATTWNNQTNEIYIALNSELSAAILGEQHAKVSLYERNKLKGEVSKLLHFWLSGYVRPGCSLGRNGVYIDNLCRHVWGPQHDSAKINVKSKRKAYIKDALDQIRDKTKILYINKSAIESWVIEYDKNVAYIKRPAKLPIIDQLGEIFDQFDPARVDVYAKEE